MKLSTRGEFGGLGHRDQHGQGRADRDEPDEGHPGRAGGIKACDQILKIGEESTVNMTLTQAVSRLRGAPGSKIDITHACAQGWDQAGAQDADPGDHQGARASPVAAAGQEGGLRPASAASRATPTTICASTSSKLSEKGMKGLVLDLRGNPGGLLDQAIKISDLFIESGTLLTTVSYAGKQREEKRATAEGTEPRYPIAVLVNSGSASASEIVAGALQEPRPRRDHRQPHLRQGLGAGALRQRRRLGAQADHRRSTSPRATSRSSRSASRPTWPPRRGLRAEGLHPASSGPTTRGASRTWSQHLTSTATSEAAHGQVSTSPMNLMSTWIARTTSRSPRTAEPRQLEEQGGHNLCLYPDRECKPTRRGQVRRGLPDPGWHGTSLARARSSGAARRSSPAPATSSPSRRPTEEQRITEALKKLGRRLDAAGAGARPSPSSGLGHHRSPARQGQGLPAA